MTQGAAPPADPRNAALLAYMNGELVPRHQALLPLMDGGLLAGDGLREMLRVHRGRALFAARHLDRLVAAARALDLEIGSAAELAGALDLTLTANRLSGDGLVLILATRGLLPGLRLAPPAPRVPPNLLIIMEHDPPGDTLARPLSLKLASVRAPSGDLSPMRINGLSRPHLNAALLEAGRAGMDDAVLLDASGFVAGCATANLFCVRKGAIFTPRGGACLNGITRSVVIDLADRDGIPLFETEMQVADLFAADEVFVTSTPRGIAPVASLDGRRLPDAPGPVTRRLIGLYAELCHRAAAGEAGRQEDA